MSACIVLLNENNEPLCSGTPTLRQKVHLAISAALTFVCAVYKGRLFCAEAGLSVNTVLLAKICSLSVFSPEFCVELCTVAVVVGFSDLLTDGYSIFEVLDVYNVHIKRVWIIHHIWNVFK